jgi:hypothetical protein
MDEGGTFHSPVIHGNTEGRFRGYISTKVGRIGVNPVINRLGDPLNCILFVIVRKKVLKKNEEHY